MIDPLHPDGGDPAQVCVAGDWHGNTQWAVSALERIAGTTRVILHAGDWGLWRETPQTIKYISRQNRLLIANDSYLVVTPGNHEDWDRLAALPIDPDTGLKKLTNRIWFAPRGHRWRWGEYVWMSLGGAVSVDRDRRKAGRDWWAAEAMTQLDVDSAISGGPVDVMISHDAPAGARVPGLRPHDWPAEVIKDSDAHRALLRQVVDACRPAHVWHGHLHVRYRDEVDLGWSKDRPADSGVVQVHGLDCDQGSMGDNLALVGTDGVRHVWSEEANLA